MEGINEATFWLKEVRYVPGLTQNLFSIAAGVDQNLKMGVNQQGEHDSVGLHNGQKLCMISKVNNQYLLDAKALQGTDKKTYFAMLATEGRTIDILAMLTSLETADAYELWHRRMGHPSPKALSRLVKESMTKGVQIPVSQLNMAMKRRCECCILGKQSHLPFPLSKSKTNRPLELVHVDICGPMENETNSGGRYFMAVLDDFSKFAEIVIMKRKSEAKTALVDLLVRWMNLREVDVKYLRTDGGKEFLSKVVESFCVSKGITQQVTPRHTPQQNGRVERLNRTLKEKVRCMLLDCRLHAEWWGAALEYAAYLRNCLPASGKTMTPFELFHHEMPDLKLVKVFGCKAYVRLEKKDKALTKLGPQSETGIFLGIEPNTKAYRVLIGSEIRVSRHVVFSEEKFRQSGTVEGPMPVEHEEYDEEPDVCEEDYDVLRQIREEQVYRDPFLSAQIRDARTGETHLIEDDDEEEVTGPALQFPRETNRIMEPSLLRPLRNPSENDESNVNDSISSDDESSDDEDADFSGPASRRQDEVSGDNEVSDNSAALPSAPAQGATNRYSLRSKGPVSPGNVVALRVMALAVSNSTADVTIPRSFAEAMRTSQAVMWKDAMGEEMNSIVSKDTFVWEPRPRNSKVIPTRWVFAIKQDAMGNIQRFKARVVAKGFKQIEGVDFNETYAPVCDQNTRRVLFAIAAQQKLHMHQIDVKTAFLNGDLTDITYCEPAPGYAGEKGMVWKLKKALYGLRQAPRAWHDCLVKALVAGDFVVSQADPGLFMKQTKHGVTFLITYVDDMIIAGADLSEVETVKKYLAKVFDVTDLGEVAHFLGNIVVRNSNSVRVSNPVKIKELLADYGITNPRKVTVPMDPSFVVTEMSVEAGKSGGSGKPLPEENRYNELIGSLMYLANTTRPDLMLAVGLLSRFRNKPTTAHWAACLRVLAYLHHTPDFGLEYNGNHDLVGYVDSAFADDKDNYHSTMGFTFLMNGAAVSWQSKKQRGIATSTVEAEYVAFHLAAQHALWLQQLLWEMIGRRGPVTIYCDSTGCISNLKNFITTGHTKHIAVKYHASRQMVAKKQVEPVYVATDDNVADVFTKPLVNAKFSKFVDGLGMT
jgi:transposase InsO family protein